MYRLLNIKNLHILAIGCTYLFKAILAIKKYHFY
jgi:hypothetical protein